MPQHTPDDWDRHAERRNGSGRRWSDDLKAHDDDAYAHAQLVDRLSAPAAMVRSGLEKRIGDLERFAARVIVIGVMFGLVLGGVAGAVVARMLH